MENELYHHGILGMKWGVRRFQNTDGSLTNAGKERYSAKDAMQIAKGVLDPKNGIIDEYRPNRQKPIGQRAASTSALEMEKRREASGRNHRRKPVEKT